MELTIIIQVMYLTNEQPLHQQSPKYRAFVINSTVHNKNTVTNYLKSYKSDKETETWHYQTKLCEQSMDVQYPIIITIMTDILKYN